LHEAFREMFPKVRGAVAKDEKEKAAHNRYL
jgi:hypothetical protein